MSRDPREQAMNDAARNILVQTNYDSHFATLEDRVQVETRLWLARFDVMCNLIGVDPATFLRMTTSVAIESPKAGFNVGRGEFHEGDTCSVDGLTEMGRGQIATVYPDGSATVIWSRTVKWHDVIREDE